MENDDVKLGRALSGLRLRQSIPLRSLARVMGISHSYLSMLEGGRRHWSRGMEDRYRNALLSLTAV